MSMQMNNVENVSDIIKVMQAGVDFYREALDEIDDQGIKATFNRMIETKRDLIDTLQPLAIEEQGQVESKQDILVGARKYYTHVASKISSDGELTYVKQLEELEDKVLEAFDDALDADQPPYAQLTLKHAKAQAQSMHDEMKRLQETLKH